MNTIFGGSLFLLAGILAGFASAAVIIESYGAAPIEPGSPWQSRDNAPGSAGHPYARDHFLLAGRFPPAAGQMREFSAARSGDGNVLNGRCDYVLTAKSAPPLWWSVVSYSGSAQATATSVMTADMAVAESDGSIRLAVSRVPQSGNWIRPPSAGGFTLLFTIARPSPNLSDGTLPLFTIDRSGC